MESIRFFVVVLVLSFIVFVTATVMKEKYPPQRMPKDFTPDTWSQRLIILPVMVIHNETP